MVMRAPPASVRPRATPPPPASAVRRTMSRPSPLEPPPLTPRSSAPAGRPGCTSGRVRVSASPASGWFLDNWTSGAVTEATVEFRQGDGKVEVRVQCGAAGPLFSVETGTSGDGGDSGSGSSDGGG